MSPERAEQARECTQRSNQAGRPILLPAPAGMVRRASGHGGLRLCCPGDKVVQRDCNAVRYWRHAPGCDDRPDTAPKLDSPGATRVEQPLARFEQLGIAEPRAAPPAVVHHVPAAEQRIIIGMELHDVRQGRRRNLLDIDQLEIPGEAASRRRPGRSRCLPERAIPARSRTARTKNKALACSRSNTRWTARSPSTRACISACSMGDLRATFSVLHTRRLTDRLVACCAHDG
jgi:hypothetical protein